MPTTFTLVNERDGGIGGVDDPAFLPCETGYNTEKGVECYESTKGEGALVYQPLSTGITYQLIPKATADQISRCTQWVTAARPPPTARCSSGYSTTPATYWDARIDHAVKHILDQEGGEPERQEALPWSITTPPTARKADPHTRRTRPRSTATP